MKHSEIARQNCCLAKAAAVVGERWNLLLLRQFFLGLHHFDDFQKTLGIARNILSDRLKQLVDAGVIEKRTDRDTGGRAYWLTEKGHDLYPTVAALLEWGDRHLAAPEGSSVVRIHKSCGSPTKAKLVCSCCEEQITARDVEVLPGPSFDLGSPLAEVRELSRSAR